MAYRKGQAAIEYLMNYAWAIALIIIVGAAIYGLNIGGIRNSISSSGSQLDSSTGTVAVTGYIFKTGTPYFNVTFQNNGANLINVTTVTVTEFDGTAVSGGPSCTMNKNLYSGGTSNVTECGINMSTVSAATAKTAGQPYTIKIQVSYKDATTLITYTPTYTLKEKVQ